MKFMLDSNVVIAVAFDADDGVRARLSEHDEGDFVMSSIAYAEVMHGSIRGKPPGFQWLETLVEEVPVLPFDYAAARAYATLPFKKASYDRLIAAHALSRNLIVVTDNEKHFADVPGLIVENWTAR